MSNEQTKQRPIEYALSLGSNVGNRLKHLTTARDLLDAIPGIELLDAAPVYETDCVDVQPEHQDTVFLNTILIVLTDLPAEELFEITQGIETDKGRMRTDDRNSPRPIDIDIIYAGRLSCQSDNITIPHPRWSVRRFVVQPLADVRPGLLLPGQTRTVKELLEALPAEPEVVLYREKW